MSWISNWKKFEIKNDTLYHLSFGELADSAKAKINYIEKNGFELYYPKDSVNHIFKKMKIIIDNKTTNADFWDEFYKRRKNANCFPESIQSN